MPSSHVIDVEHLVDTSDKPIQRGFYFDKDKLLVFVSNPKSRFVEGEQECNFSFLEEVGFKQLTPIPTSDLEKVAQEYEEAGCAYKAGWLRRYLGTIRTSN